MQEDERFFFDQGTPNKQNVSMVYPDVSLLKTTALQWFEEE